MGFTSINIQTASANFSTAVREFKTLAFEASTLSLRYTIAKGIKARGEFNLNLSVPLEEPVISWFNDLSTVVSNRTNAVYVLAEKHTKKGMLSSTGAGLNEKTVNGAKGKRVWF